MTVPLPGVSELARRLRALGWVTELYVGGSAATGDYLPGVSDLDLVALVDGPVDADRQAVLAALHADLDRGAAAGADLGCVYVPQPQLPEPATLHPTWTHGRLVHRILSGIARAELVHHGYAVFGRPPQETLPTMDSDDVRRAAQAELTGYWARAAAQPWWWLDPVLAELGLTAMARGRHALATGRLLSKSAAIDVAHAPPWLLERLRARRRGEAVPLPRLRTAGIAWLDARRTTAAARRWTAPTR